MRVKGWLLMSHACAWAYRMTSKNLLAFLFLSRVGRSESRSSFWHTIQSTSAFSLGLGLGPPRSRFGSVLTLVSLDHAYVYHGYGWIITLKILPNCWTGRILCTLSLSHSLSLTHSHSLSLSHAHSLSLSHSLSLTHFLSLSLSGKNNLVLRSPSNKAGLRELLF